ncbi:hypothetical protein BO82DRAFT_355863 [Aspergillus uvarum CBS 121591]|uniref:Uncharacterized protein n=1 Tax=Aspergillus uvarum CBS 121591 TaxID=1448315 RepID=A0A319CWQ3_9EURO|nr:hypothetical protein BO82DRAFT_355863 [Aspergillus uvarum CBS 121591]PYH80068.1 hypothetical protein BO82DRAFT_355863 [Aspergillus uvarum CBS 121591]
MRKDLVGLEPAVLLQQGLRGGVDGRDAGLVPAWSGGGCGVVGVGGGGHGGWSWLMDGWAREMNQDRS